MASVKRSAARYSGVAPIYNVRDVGSTSMLASTQKSATSSVELTCGHSSKYAMASAHVGPGTCRRRPVPAGEYDGENVAAPEESRGGDAVLEFELHMQEGGEVAHAGKERSAIRVAGDREAWIVLQRAGAEPRDDGEHRHERHGRRTDDDGR